MSNLRMTSRATRLKRRAVAAPGSIMRWTWLATLTAVFGGCASTTTQPEPPAASATSATSQDTSGTSTADLASHNGQENRFPQDGDRTSAVPGPY